MKRCERCKKEKKFSEYHYNVYRKRPEKVWYKKTCKVCSNINSRVRECNNRAEGRYLPNSFTDFQYENLEAIFNNSCALVNSPDYHLAHFIPLSWGHGGSYMGNLFLLDGRLNQKQHAKNPFDWVKEEGIESKICKNKWNRLVQYLASLNGLSALEFKEFVYWCENNKRCLEETKLTEKIPSLELWSTSRHKEFQRLNQDLTMDHLCDGDRKSTG